MRWFNDRPRVLWQALSPAGHVRLLAAIFFTFSSLGFVTDLFHVDTVPSWPALTLRVLYSGLAAVAYFLAFTRSLWLLLPAAGFQFGGILLLDRWPQVHRFPLHSPIPLEVLQSRLTVDAVGIIGATTLAYVFFIQVLTTEGVRQTRLRAEMALAREIHDALAPPIDMRVGHVEFFGRSSPSSEVGGDLVDVVEGPGGVLAVVADVAGHGVSAGTLMAMTRSAIRVRFAAATSLETLFADVDRLLVDLHRPDKFVTAALLRFEPTGAVEAALAGHLPVLIARAGGGMERIENARPPLGVSMGMPSPTTRVPAGPGDLFALVTDGMSEVSDREGRQLGVEGLEAVLREMGSEPLSVIADALFERARKHGRQTDDQTLLLARVH